jgi:hypothetical protein
MKRFAMSAGLILGGSLGACKPPAEAPAELGELSIFLFENFDSEDEQVLQDASLNLEEYLLTLDMDAKADDRAVTLPLLPTERMGTVSATEGADPALQIPVGVSARSRHDFDTNLSLLKETNYVCIDSDTSKFSERTLLTDVDCIVDGTCATLETSQWVRKENPLAKIWFEIFRNYRTLELEDGRTVMFARTVLPKSFVSDGGGSSWDQNYAIEAWIPESDGDGTLRFYGLWSSVDISLISDKGWAVLVQGGIDQSYEFADNFLDPEVALEDYCNEDRDPDLTPPE